MAEISISRIAEARLDDLAELRLLAIAEVVGRRGGLRLVQEFEECSKKSSSNLETIQLLAYFEGVAVGYAIASKSESTVSNYWVIVELFVALDFRRLGVGSVLFESILAELDGRMLEVTVLPGDIATKNFYETYGFRARALVLERKVD